MDIIFLIAVLTALIAVLDFIFYRHSFNFSLIDYPFKKLEEFLDNYKQERDIHVQKWVCKGKSECLSALNSDVYSRITKQIIKDALKLIDKDRG